MEITTSTAFIFRVTRLVVSRLLDADEEGIYELPIWIELLGEVAVDEAGLNVRDKGFETLMRLQGFC